MSRVAADRMTAAAHVTSLPRSPESDEAARARLFSAQSLFLEIASGSLEIGGVIWGAVTPVRVRTTGDRESLRTWLVTASKIRSVSRRIL
jgi:hypothetical protein